MNIIRSRIALKVPVPQHRPDTVSVIEKVSYFGIKWTMEWSFVVYHEIIDYNRHLR